MNPKIKQSLLFFLGYGLVFGTPFIWYYFVFYYVLLTVLLGPLSELGAKEFLLAFFGIACLGIPSFGFEIIKYARKM